MFFVGLAILGGIVAALGGVDKSAVLADTVALKHRTARRAKDLGIEAFDAVEILLPHGFEETLTALEEEAWESSALTARVEQLMRLLTLARKAKKEGESLRPANLIMKKNETGEDLLAGFHSPLMGLKSHRVVTVTRLRERIVT